jgi:hypothetical protein
MTFFEFAFKANNSLGCWCGKKNKYWLGKKSRDIGRGRYRYNVLTFLNSSLDFFRLSADPSLLGQDFQI